MSQYIAHPSNLCGCGCKGSGACGGHGIGDSGDGLSGLPLFPAGMPMWQQALIVGGVGFAIYQVFKHRREDERSRKYRDGYVQVTEGGKKRWKHRRDL